MRKFGLHFTIVALAGLLPVASFGVIAAVQPSRYHESFYGGLVTKDNRLEAVAGQRKIVFLGGSSLSFGLRSDLLGQALDYEVVDYGLYAPLGIKTMAELAKGKLKSGDIVVFAPELSKETYSTKMDYRMFLKCIEDKNELFFRLSLDDQAETLSNLPYFLSERAVANVEIRAPYDKASFNEYGDILSDKVVNNVMPTFYDSGQLIEPSTALLDRDFINYVNDYASSLKRHGVTTYFTFSPTNALALQEEGLPAFESGLKEKLQCQVLGSVKDFTYHQNWFYDTNYHLNYAGTVVHSKALTDALAAALGKTVTYAFPEVTMPRAQYEPEPEPEPEPEDAPFLIQKFGNEYFLTGVSAALKEKEAIRVPKTIDGHTITGVSARAFEGCEKLHTIIFPETIETFDNDIFLGCTALTSIYLTNKMAPMTVGNGFLNGCQSSVRIYILRSARSSYTTGYTWSVYKNYFKLYNIEDLPDIPEIEN